ncbi:MAG: DEAD/DEAH box helicase [Deltaproteobacteria bacterium]|jgi:superfamily II RNA helicase|nr:DEAD/DEAH box helicase [Deltaproteobacteria bacterium]
MPHSYRSYRLYLKNKNEKKEALKKKPKDTPDSALDIWVTPPAQKFLDQIGQPEPTPFVPDPFQLEAVQLIENQDVIVAAPTGSGKTWIALQAMEKELQNSGRAWYASPLKALSNSKYLEFSRHFGEDRVGLLTGDLRLNTMAPLIVGTTEILRNQLYDSMSLDSKTFESSGQVNCDLVILDEAHYLGDPERGVVWEEVLIYLPSRIRLLLLSATIANAGELASWLAKIRSSQVKVVWGEERPVPLAPLCYHSGGLETLSQSSKIIKDFKKNSRRDDWVLRPSLVLKALEQLSLTPAIFFLASRKQCDLAAQSINLGPDDEPERREKRLALIDEYTQTYPFLTKHRHLDILKDKAVASHHAGHLPIYKMLVEDLMTEGLLRAIFATSTVSAGVNFPARTVVIPQSDRFNGTDFTPLTATELAQMTGRAGRRGRDLIGFAVILPGPYTRLKYLATLFNSSPEPIKSQLLMNFSMVLNLLNALEIEDIWVLLTKSLAAWQSSKKKNEASLGQASLNIWRDFQKHWTFLKKVDLVNHNNRLTTWGEMTAKFRLDHPLVLYQCVKQKALPTDNPAMLAAVMASVINENPNVSTAKPPKELQEAFKNVLKATSPMIQKLKDNGFAWPTLDFSASFAIWAWANNHSFDQVSRIYGHDQGDAARLILRAAERLNQLRDLPGQEELVKAAALARQKILREPVI